MAGNHYLLVAICLALISLVSSEPKATDTGIKNATENIHDQESRAAYDLPPPPAPAPVPEPTPTPPGPVVPPPIPGGFFGLPGFGLSKNLNIGALAGYLPLLGGLGGGLGGPGGVPPVGGVGGPGVGGPGIGGGFLGPSYIPATWLGSALGAKYDILFPLVIFVFFVAGVWTVINFLLALLVPLIGKKLGALGALGAMGAMKKVRAAEEKDNCAKEQLELARKVMEAIQKKH